MAVEIDTVLVPVDGTDQSEEAAGYAIAIAKRYEASVHILHVVDEHVAMGIEQGNINPDAVADEHRAFMKVVHERVRDMDGHVPVTQSSVFGYSTSQLRQHPVSVVLDAAEDIDADFITIPRESSAADPDAMLGKVAQYVLSYASQPVLSV